METVNKWNVRKAKNELDTLLKGTDLFPYNEGEKTKNDIIDLLIDNKDIFIKILKKI